MDYGRFDAVPPPAEGGGSSQKKTMDYDQLLDGCCEVGVQLIRFGGEIQRAEDTVRRLLAACGLEGEVFAIPNCLWASVKAPDGAHTRMRRVPAIATDIEGIERFNDLSRRLCANPPEDPARLSELCRETLAGMRSYPALLVLGGYFLGAFFFALFFGGTLAEGAGAGLAGVVCGGVLLLLDRIGANPFISTLASAFALGAVCCALPALGAPVSLELTMTGALMVLVPGLVFTSFMSDLLTGDLMAGLATFTRAVLSGGAIALGAGTAMALLRGSSGSAVPPVSYAPALYCLFAFAGCLGFCAPFNVQGVGALLCCLGGALGWAVYLLALGPTGSTLAASLIAAVLVAAYSEVMARVRRCPATSYLTISMFPLVPGLTVYQAMDFGLRGDTDRCLEQLFLAAGIAGCLAMGLLLVSAALDLWRKRRKIL